MEKGTPSPVPAPGPKPPDLPHRMEDWTKDDVRLWLLTKLKVPQEYADKLYDEDVSGASLAYFEKKDLIELGIRHGPAVLIVKNVEKVKKAPDGLDKCSDTKETAKKCVGKELSSIVEDRDVVALQTANSPKRDPPDQMEASASEQAMSSSWTETEQSNESPAHINLHKSHDAKKDIKPKIKQGDGPTASKHLPVEKRMCQPRPFDQNCPSFMYTQNDLLPPETGPTNLIDPIHEYKLLNNTENASEKEILHKFSSEVFRFAAACMNVRTNGTIHFGVQNAPHGQVVGIDLASPDKYVDEFDLRLKQYFEENQSVARACIRPPKFIRVQCLDGSYSKKWLIEVDIVPTYSETQETLFYTSVIEEIDKKNHKMKCLYVREGANTINLLAGKNQRIMQERVIAVSADVQTWASTRKSMDNGRYQKLSQSHQGQKLQQLITLGRDTLEQSLQFLVVANKCPESELEHLSFLKELKLFAVLDFDPESEATGACSFFRKDRITNLHFPRMYNNSDSVSATIEKLNLYKQTSWVFCIGRASEENKDDLPFDPSNWLKKRAAEVSDMINFICKPDILPRDKLLVVFLLHSGITDVSHPLLETFCTIYRELGGEDNMLCICKDSTVFSQWKEVVGTRCQIDISSKCIYELSLYEVNCTIKKVKEPQTQSSQRYLPSTGLSSVLLTKRDEELMTFLDILSENECENTEIESMETFRDFKKNIEENFYRGGEVTWWNFYLSERPGCLPFIKRDKYEDLYNLMTPTGGHTAPCIIINLFHHPGCGGTTLAMHVLWNLRNKYRCAVVKNNTAQNSEIAAQVIHLLTYGKGQESRYTPVLLLVDNWDDAEDLQRCILYAAHERKQDSLLVIILNCQRSQFPAKSSRKSRIDSMFITYELSPKEQDFFQVKLQELRGHHDKPETFYGFMIMSNNFSETYIDDLVCNTVKDLNVSTHTGQLISFLALLNTYVNGSSMSLSLCEEFVGIRNVLWGQETLKDKMDPYFTLLICFNVEEFGTYQAVRFLHQTIAKHCLKVLTGKYNLKLSEIATNLLHCDLLYKSGMGKDILLQNILSMLITRQRKELGDDKDTLFSPLVEQMPLAEGKEVLTQAIKRFDRNATVPQALSRIFYLKEKDFSSALLWALDAQQKNNNSYIADTLGQVYKCRLKHEIECNKEISPDYLDLYLELSLKATQSFKDSQELAKRNEPMDCFEQKYRRRQDVYNTSGYVGEMDVIIIILNVLEDISFDSKTYGHQWHRMIQFLKGNLPISVLYETSCPVDDTFLAVLSRHEKFLTSLKPRMKEIFLFFENYFTYLKPRSMETISAAEERNKKRVSELFTKYVKIFCKSGEERETERAKQPNISLQQTVEENRCYLEGKRADTFAGLLQWLNEKNGSQIEHILNKWQFIFENSSRKSSTNRVNYILANIIVHCVRPNSTKIRKYNDLITLLNELLQSEGTHSERTEVYFLAMVLLWPGKDSALEIFKNICTYVTSTKRSFHRRFHYMFPAKSCIAHFYLGKSKGLKRIVHKAKIDQAIDSDKQKKPHQLWQSGAIWKEPGVGRLLLRIKGKTENGEIYVYYPGNLRIPVRPVYLGGLRSGHSMEEVSFYLGFTMEGPVAYDLKYMNDP